MNLAGAPALVSRERLESCAVAARQILREREARYPALIEAGKLPAATAAAALELARVLVAQWTWVVDPAAPPLPESDGRDFGAWNHDLLSDVTGAAKRARQNAERRPDDEQAARFADLCDALAWWQSGHPGCTSVSRIVMATDVERSMPAVATKARAA